MTLRRNRYYQIILAGLTLFAFGLPFSKSVSTVSLVFVLGGVLLFAINHPAFRTSLVNNASQPVTLQMLLVLFVGSLGLFFTSQFSEGIHIIHKQSDLVLIYFMVAVLLGSAGNEEEETKYAEQLLIAFLAGVAFLDAIGILTFAGVFGGKKFALPLAPLHIHHIWFANLNALGFYGAVSLFLFPGRLRVAVNKMYLILFGLLVLTSIVLSTSRTAWMGMLGTLIAVSFVFMNEKKRFFIAVGMLLALCAAIYAFNDIIHERIANIVVEIRLFLAGNPATSIGQRFLMWKAAFRMFLSNPIFGVGTGDYVLMMREYVSAGAFPNSLLEFNQPHNMFLFSLATNGLLGLAALLYLFIQCFRISMKIWNENVRARLFALLGCATTIHFMVAGLTDSLFNIQMLRYSFAFLIGVCLRNSLLKPIKP